MSSERLWDNLADRFSDEEGDDEGVRNIFVEECLESLNRKKPSTTDRVTRKKTPTVDKTDGFSCSFDDVFGWRIEN